MSNFEHTRVQCCTDMRIAPEYTWFVPRAAIQDMVKGTFQGWSRWALLCGKHSDSEAVLSEVMVVS